MAASAAFEKRSSEEEEEERKKNRAAGQFTVICLSARSIAFPSACATRVTKRIADDICIHNVNIDIIAVEGIIS